MNRKLLILFVLASHHLFGDLQKELNNFFDKFGSSTNVSSGDIYNGQKAGYLTGGGIGIRNRVMNSQPLTVNLPRFDAGCGGIDIYAGGFSFIDHAQLIATLKSIGSSASGYAFMLGLETVSPQVANTIKLLQSWANTINSQSINSCEIASSMVGSVWPRRTMASQQICRMAKLKDGRFNDYVAGRHNCSDRSHYKAASEKIKNENPEIILEEFNVAWEAIQKQRFLKDNPCLAEFFMTLMGTVVVKEEQGKTIERFPSKISDSTFLQALLEGGKTTIYSCKDAAQKHCLIMQPTIMEFAPSMAWLGKIKTVLLSIQNKILKDEELASHEKEMLTKSSIPIYRVINVLTAYKKGYSPIDLYQIADLIAMDLLNQYLREAITLVREGAYQLRESQMFADIIDEYLEDLQRVESTVALYENKCRGLADQEFQLMEKIMLIEEQLAAEIIL